MNSFRVSIFHQRSQVKRLCLTWFSRTRSKYKYPYSALFKKWPRKRHFREMLAHSMILFFPFIPFATERMSIFVSHPFSFLSQRCNLLAFIFCFFPEINSKGFCSFWVVLSFNGMLVVSGWKEERFLSHQKNYEEQEECNFMRLKEGWAVKGLVEESRKRFFRDSSSTWATFSLFLVRWSWWEAKRSRNLRVNVLCVCFNLFPQLTQELHTSRLLRSFFFSLGMSYIYYSRSLLLTFVH